MASMQSVPAAFTRTGAVHPVDQVLPLDRLAVYGLQHVLAFYAGAVIVPLPLAGVPQGESHHLDQYCPT